MIALRSLNRIAGRGVRILPLLATLALPLTGVPAHAAAAPKPAAAWVRSTLPNGLEVIIVPTSRRNRGGVRSRIS